MAETIIRPSMKFVTIGYAVVLLFIIALASAVLWLGWPPLIAWLSPLLLILPLRAHIRNRSTQLTILDDRLRLDCGLASKTTRTIMVSRIQDITVHQSAGQ